MTVEVQVVAGGPDTSTEALLAVQHNRDTADRAEREGETLRSSKRKHTIYSIFTKLADSSNHVSPGLYLLCCVLQEQLALAQQKRELQHLVTVTRNLPESHPSGRTTSELMRVL